MRYVIGFLTVGCMVVALVGLALRNEVLLGLSLLMFLVCLAVCGLDTYIAVSRGVKGNQTFNWAVLSRFARKLK